MLYIIFLTLLLFVFLFFLTNPPSSFLNLSFKENFENFSQKKEINECIPFHKNVGISKMSAYSNPNSPLNPYQNQNIGTYLGQNKPLQNEPLPSELPRLKPKEGRLVQTKLLLDGVWDVENIWHPRNDSATKKWFLTPKGNIPVFNILDVKNFIKIPEKISMSIEGKKDLNPCMDDFPFTQYISVDHDEIQKI